MAAQSIIDVQNVTKRYQIGGPRDSYGTMRDAIAGAFHRGAQRAGRLVGAGGAPPDDERWAWALRDVSFAIGQGEVVGVIGRNGAGKSTILKVLSRITEPTSGRAVLRGRVGSLLEVGTGFHGELSGRENVYLNGAILGMRRAEIAARFDEIVEFAEIGRYLDTPVKRYSSGMMVRLAFAVAAHLEPEILLVDEVLAVGDVGFQRKCIGKMGDVAGEGRTVLFVSHNMALVQTLCQRGIVLDGGRVVVDGPIEDAVGWYLATLDQASQKKVGERRDRHGRQDVIVERLDISDPTSPGGTLATGRPARFTFHTNRDQQRVTCSFTIFNQLGHAVATLNSGNQGPGDVRSDDTKRFVCDIDELPLQPGRYRLDVRLWGRHDLEDMVEGATVFDVEQGTMGGRPMAGHATGDLALRHTWAAPPMD